MRVDLGRKERAMPFATAKDGVATLVPQLVEFFNANPL
jgi:hypothetical protein